MTEKNLYPKPLISFDNEGTEIFNPFVSPLGGITCSPEDYGFEKVLQESDAPATWRLDIGREIDGAGYIDVTKERIYLFSKDSVLQDAHRLPTPAELKFLLAGKAEAEKTLRAIRGDADAEEQGGLTYNQVSLDGGMTWQNVNNDVRIVFREADEDDDGLKDLHVIVTHEGIILDRVDQESAECEGTACLYLEDLVEFTKREGDGETAASPSCTSKE